jgi:hypothetical protein
MACDSYDAAKERAISAVAPVAGGMCRCQLLYTWEIMAFFLTR